MKIYSDKIMFNAPAQRVYDVLTKEPLHALITDAEVELGKNIDDEFKFFGGAISGIITDLITGEKIVWSWNCYVNGWPEDHMSQVEISLNDFGDDQCELQIEHSNIPEEAYDLIVDGWKERYWEPMQKFLQKK